MPLEDFSSGSPSSSHRILNKELRTNSLYVDQPPQVIINQLTCLILGYFLDHSSEVIFAFVCHPFVLPTKISQRPGIDSTSRSLHQHTHDLWDSWAPESDVQLDRVVNITNPYRVALEHLRIHYSLPDLVLDDRIWEFLFLVWRKLWDLI